MAGMRALGRVYDVIPVASGVGFSMKNCSGVGIVASTTTTAATSLAFTAATSYGGTYNNVVPGSGFGQPNTWYNRAASTAAWTSNAAVWTTNSLAIDGTINHMSYVDYLVSELADTYDYLKVTGTNCTLSVILYDLTVQRTPQNLAIISA